jgi:hypothetical protein
MALYLASDESDFVTGTLKFNRWRMDFIMKTLRYRIGNEVKPGILDADENIRDASSLVSDWDSRKYYSRKIK